MHLQTRHVRSCEVFRANVVANPSQTQPIVLQILRIPSPTYRNYSQMQYGHCVGRFQSRILQRATAEDGLGLGAEAVPKHTPFHPAKLMALARSLAAFALPTLLIPLADPIMSLIDTIALGQWSSSLALASLGPCGLIFNFSFYSFMALSIATVSLTSERIRTSYRQAAKSIGAALFIGSVGGICLTAILLLWGPALLQSTQCDPILLPLATEYLRIRAIAAPAAIYTSIAQSALLGQRDSTTPFKIVLFSIMASFLGDVVFIGGLNMGVTGAAWTTVIAQFGSAVLLWRALQRTKAAPSMEIPCWEELHDIWRAAKNLGIFYIAKTTSYLLLQANATRLPAAMLAAHQPTWQLWGLCSFANTPLEQAALAFIPSANSDRERQELILVLLSIGTFMSFVYASIAHGIPALLPWLLVSDRSLWPLMKSVWIPGSLSLIACGLDVSSTGILLASKDSAYVAQSMVISLAVLGTFVHISRNHFAGLQGVWWSLFVFFVMRMCQSLPRAVFHHFSLLGEDDGRALSADVVSDLNVKAT